MSIDTSVQPSVDQPPVEVAERLPLTEAVRRLPTWQEGLSIKLCNGTTWQFPKPRFRFPLGVDAEGKLSFAANRTRLRIGPQIDDILDRIIEADGDGDLLLAVAELAVLCLRSNYQISDDELGELLFWEPDDEVNVQVWRKLVEFANGNYDPEANGEPPLPKGEHTLAGSGLP